MPAWAAKDPRRPWWGLGDVAPVVVVFGFLLIASALAPADAADEVEVSIAFLAIAALIQQSIQMAWPWIVSRWKGRGMALDWKWLFKPIDLAIGLGVAVLAQIGAVAAGAATGAIVGLDDDSTAENTQFLVDAKGSVWLWVMIFVVTVGAPFSEELLFRGLIHRAFEKRGGPILAIIGSTFLFTIIHLNGEPLTSDGQIVLWASIGVVGLVFGVTAQYVGRLAPAIIAHMFFNGFSTLVVLLTQ